ncbi:hypothetical protein ID866_4452 [Astraeus odoratus]|nr:hypothetical protein ID866_4452 [Astraeus odoratus]
MNTRDDGIKHSQPIPINTHHMRHRSFSTSDSSHSPVSPPPIQTPSNITPPRISPISSSSSPILQFLSQSPAKPPATFPFRGFGHPPVIEDEILDELPVTAHARRSSISGLFSQQPPVTDVNHERGVSLLRRLSLGSTFKPALSIRNEPSTSPPQPAPPPNTAATSPVVPATTPLTRKPRRSATVTESGKPRRAPSPIGERILKGHFGGFD